MGYLYLNHQQNKPYQFSFAFIQFGYSAPDSIAEYCDVLVCLSVRDPFCRTTCPIFTKFFMRVRPYYLCRCCDTLCTSGFMNDRLRILPRNRRCRSELIRSSIDLSPWHILKLIHQRQHRTWDRFWYLRLPCFSTIIDWSRDSWFTATWDRIIFLLEDLVLYFRITTCIWINVFV